MSYLVLARKWRPGRFDEVVGQAHVTRTLSNAIEMDRVAHAFLFAGVRGVGKTSLARILAKSLNCAEGPTVTPCDACESCRAVAAGTAVDVIEIDGASNNSVDDIRDLRETVPYRPALGRFKIYVIDEVHMLSISAFNALLKTLEEPPPHVKFIFATTEAHKIPVTILSRCQRYDFRRIPTAAIVERIGKILAEEGIEAEPAALDLIGREADGSMRDALSILDQVLAAGSERISGPEVAGLLGVVDRRVYHDLCAALVDGDPRRCLELVRDVDRQGYDIPTFSRGLLEQLRDLVVVGVCGGDGGGLVAMGDEELAELQRLAGRAGNETLHRLFKHFSDSLEAITRSAQPRVMLEMALARLADLGELVPAAELVARLEALAAGGAIPRSGGGGGGGSRGGAQRAEPRRAPATPSDPIGAAPIAPQPKPFQLPEAAPAQRRPPTRDARPLPDTDAWGAIVDSVRPQRPQLASILECGVPHPDEAAGVLELRFAEECTVAAQVASDPQKLREIADLLAEHCGRPVRVGVRIDKETGVPVLTRRRQAEAAEARRREEEAREHPLVLRALSELGGSIAGVKMIDDGEDPPN